MGAMIPGDCCWSGMPSGEGGGGDGVVVTVVFTGSKGMTGSSGVGVSIVHSGLY